MIFKIYKFYIIKFTTTTTTHKPMYAGALGSPGLVEDDSVCCSITRSVKREKNERRKNDRVISGNANCRVTSGRVP